MLLKMFKIKNALPHLVKMSAMANQGTADINSDMADFLKTD